MDKEKKYRYVDGSVYNARDIHKLFGELREKNGLKPKNLADEVKGISAKALSAFENNHQCLPYIKMLDAFEKMGYELVVIAVKKEDTAV